MAEKNLIQPTVCPYLHHEDDPVSVSNFPTTANHCYACTKAKSVAYEHQDYFCLHAYEDCLVYKNPTTAENVAIINTIGNIGELQYEPDDLTVYDRRVPVEASTNRGVLVAVLLVLGVLGAFFFILFQSFLNDDVNNAPTGISLTTTPTRNIQAITTVTEVVLVVTDEVNSIAGEGRASFTPTEITPTTATVSATPTEMLPSATSTATITATLMISPSKAVSLTPTVTYTFAPSSTFTPSFTSTPSTTPTATYTATLIPPATAIFTNTPRPAVQSENDVIALLDSIEATYGVEFAYPEEWQPVNTSEVIIYYEYLASLQDSLQTFTYYFHYFSRASENITPEELFKTYFAGVLFDRTSEVASITGARTIRTANGQYLVQITPNGMNSLALARELGYILNEKLSGSLLQDYERVFGSAGSSSSIWQSTFWDIFATMLVGELTSETAPSSYQFMLEYLPYWLSYP